MSIHSTPIIVNGNTKKGKKLAQIARTYEAALLSQIYDSCSADKEHAYWECREKAYDEGGYAFSIVGHNTFGFSVSWFTHEYIRLVTPKNNYMITYPDIL